MNNFIIKLLDLKEEDISSIDSIIEKDSSFFITLKPKLVPCKHCGALTSKFPIILINLLTLKF